MSLVKKINEDFLTAYKSKQTTEVSTLRMLKSTLTNKEIEKKIPKEQGLSDEEVVAIIKTEIKKRKDSIVAYDEANRTDLSAQEEKEKVILEKYLPAQMSEDQVREAVVAVLKNIEVTGPADFGKVMGAVMAATKNQADGQVVSKIVKEELEK